MAHFVKVFEEENVSAAVANNVMDILSLEVQFQRCFTDVKTTK